MEETQEMSRQKTEMQEDGEGSAVEIRDNGYFRQGWKWRQAAENYGGADAGQQEQRQQRYRIMDTDTEETPVKL